MACWTPFPGRFRAPTYNGGLPYSLPTMSILNLSAYRFVQLDDLPSLRERILERCEALALKGTILLAPEGINLFLAGPRSRCATCA